MSLPSLVKELAIRISQREGERFLLSLCELNEWNGDGCE